MPRLKLTTPAVERLKPPPNGQVEYFDALQPAFGLRVSYSGTKSWVVMTRIDGKLVRYTLGRYPAISLADARRSARDALQKAAAGIDLRIEKRLVADAAVKRAANTVRARIEEFLVEHVERNLRRGTVLEYRRVLLGSDLAGWHSRSIEDITRKDVLALLDRIGKRGTPATARLTFAYLRKFMNWCVDRDILAAAPTDRVRAPSQGAARTRALSDDEIRIVWAAFEQEPAPFGPFLKLLLLTGQRRGEVAGIRRDEVILANGQAPVWEIPADRTKNGRPHIVPLSDPALELIRAQPDTGPFVFSTTGSTPVSGFSKAKARIDVQIASVLADRGQPPLPSWTMHDLRRTVVTMMNERLRIAPHVVEAVVNHQSGAAKAGVAGVYNRALYLDERRSALEAWAEYLQGLVGTG